MESDQSIESMTVVDLRKWLEERGIPDEFCQKFEGALVNLSTFGFVIHYM